MRQIIVTMCFIFYSCTCDSLDSRLKFVNNSIYTVNFIISFDKDDNNVSKLLDSNTSFSKSTRVIPGEKISLKCAIGWDYVLSTNSFYMIVYKERDVPVLMSKLREGEIITEKDISEVIKLNLEDVQRMKWVINYYDK